MIARIHARSLYTPLGAARAVDKCCHGGRFLVATDPMCSRSAMPGRPPLRSRASGKHPAPAGSVSSPGRSDGYQGSAKQPRVGERAAVRGG